MKRIFHVALVAVVRLLSLTACAAALCAPAHAATVPQTSYADYIFHRPLLTNNIRGVVMGWPPAYRVIRSEDIDWLLEARNERRAIQAGTTNVNDKAVRSTVRRSDFDLGTFWNGWPRSDEGWLDGSVELTTARVPFSHWGRVTTNVWTYEDTASVTNRTGNYYQEIESVSNGFSVITMPLTNGLQSVFTNRWSWYYRDKETTIVTTTNVHEWTFLDWCQSDPSAPFPGNMVSPRLNWEENLIEFPTASAVSNAYQDLRSTSRLADINYLETNRCVSIYSAQSNGVLSQPLTNANHSLSYLLYVFSSTNGQFYGGSEMAHCTPFVAHVPTRFKSYFNTIGGLQRVELEAAYAPVSLSYYFRDRFNRAPSEDVTTNVIIRLTSATIDASGDTMHVHVPYNARQLCSLAATAVDLPPIPSDGVMYRPDNGETFQWECQSLGFVFIYRISPSVKLPDW